MKFSMKDVKGEEDVRGGSRVDAEGLYHVVVTSVDDSQDKFEAVIVEMKVLAGTDESQVGRGYTEWFYLSEAAIKRLKLFALVTKAAAPGGSFDPSDLLGKQCIIECKRSEYTKAGETRVSYKVGWDGFFRLDDAKVEHVPRGKSGKTIKFTDTAEPDDDNDGPDPDEWDEI